MLAFQQGEQKMVGGGDWWEGEGGAGGRNISSILTLRGLDMWKQVGRESRCMGIQKLLHMHANQTYTEFCGSRKKKFSRGTASSGNEGLEWRQTVTFITPT